MCLNSDATFEEAVGRALNQCEVFGDLQSEHIVALAHFSQKTLSDQTGDGSWRPVAATGRAYRWSSHYITDTHQRAPGVRGEATVGDLTGGQHGRVYHSLCLVRLDTARWHLHENPDNPHEYAIDLGIPKTHIVELPIVLVGRKFTVVK